jgi:hypothetical protein
MNSDELKQKFCSPLVSDNLLTHFSLASTVQQMFLFDPVFKDEFLELKYSLDKGLIDAQECEARMKHALRHSIKRNQLNSTQLTEK